VALATVADDGNCLAFDQAQVAVFVVKHFHDGKSSVKNRTIDKFKANGGSPSRWCVV
jgi:hypothetical protein